MRWTCATWRGAALGLLVLAGCATDPSRKDAARKPDISPRANESQSLSRMSEQQTIHLASAHAAVPEQPTADQPTADRQYTENRFPTVVVAPAISEEIVQGDQASGMEGTASYGSEGTPINLPTALAMIGGQHPVVGFARWRVQEAYAQLDRAKVLWLPSIQTGFNYRRRDGNYQDVQGAIVDVNLNSMNYGLGAGAVAAGSPVQPGIVARFHLADAIFLPKAAEKAAWARGHAATAILNQQLLEVGVAYLDLLEAYQGFAIIDEAVVRTSELEKITRDYAEAGQGLQSDADRTATELALLQARQVAARERQLVASTRLAHALSVPMTSELLPQDAVVVPLEMLTVSSHEATLIATGLVTRPELKESQALVAAAIDAYKREKYAPFVPSVLLGFSTTSFGGGLGGNAENFGGRYDADAMMVWETRNVGFGEHAARKERGAQVQQASFAKLRVMDQVAQEVAEAHVQVEMRKQQIEITQVAIARANDSFQRNMQRILEGQGLPIEVLQSIQALETSQRAYLNAVTDYNRAQLRLQWALGWPVTGQESTDSAN